MWGLHKINRNFVPDSSGRDMIILGHQEFREGRSKPLPYLTASLGRQCYPRKRPTGPKPPTAARVTHLNRGLWQCSGQWTQTAGSAKSLPKSNSVPVLGVPRGGYHGSFAAWEEGRRHEMHLNPAGLKTWASHATLPPPAHPHCSFKTTFRDSVDGAHTTLRELSGGVSGVARTS
mmetsp:Transcript_38992/g.107355  ORF Transcript_38992/g.107355 Transcript_38992/m.107355 type:complete len:175 (+) Transcript_38992:135-659(+)|eukprot:CAMPEP_0117539180 /NCGR_PEP_ID=MMETSP0784-20121206/42854_1 /TAXON_ID=39447 /ORGANISM="" /LENGTH=174 /DNA_ID=CAMNT_0005335803 /DNA_START=68 /DNA_END=592 /DNA_ORIENTATION=-